MITPYRNNRQQNNGAVNAGFVAGYLLGLYEKFVLGGTKSNES